jgi:hypothetical protein
MGLKATFIHVGETKVLGNGFEALSPAARKHLQSKVDECMDGFAALVAEFRPSLSIDEIRKLEADTFMGQHAVDVGLADRIGTARSVIDELNRARGGRTISHRKEILMKNENSSPEANETSGITQAQFDAAVADAKQQGHSEGTDAASKRYNEALNAEGVKGNPKRMAAALDLLGTSAEMSGEAVAVFVTANVAEASSKDIGDDAYDELRSDASDLTKPEAGEPEKKGLSAHVDKRIERSKS